MAWEIAAEVLKAANSAEGFTGEDSTVGATLRAKQMAMVTNAPAEEFDLLGLFRLLAKDDFNRSIELAKGFSGEYSALRSNDCNCEVGAGKIKSEFSPWSVVRCVFSFSQDRKTQDQMKQLTTDR